MTKRKRLLVVAAILFIAFESVMFYLIHIVDAEPGNYYRYLCIIAAAIFSWITLFVQLVTARAAGDRASKLIFNISDGNLIRIAMLFTLVADYYMVALDEADNYTGVKVFLGTQLFILLHILANDHSKKGRKVNLISRIFLVGGVIAIAYAILGDQLDSMAIIAVIYYANLCANAIFAHRIGRGGIVLTVGLILFALCDINVGLTALNEVYEGGFREGSLLYNLMNSDLDLIWVFYIPSQTLIPLSLLLFDKKKK